MVAIIDIKEWVEQTGKVTAHQHRCDTCFVGLDGQSDDIAHQLHVFAEVFWKSIIRALHRHEWLILILCVVGCLHHFATHLGCTLLDFAYAGEVFIQLCTVFTADFMAKRSSIVSDAVKHARHPLAAIVVEEAVKRLGWIDLTWNGRLGVQPGNVGAVGHREVGFVIAGEWLFAGEDQTWLDGVIAKTCCEDLIDADTTMENGSSGEGHSGEDVSCHSGVDADADGWPVEESADDI